MHVFDDEACSITELLFDVKIAKEHYDGSILEMEGMFWEAWRCETIDEFDGIIVLFIRVIADDGVCAEVGSGWSG